MTRYTGNHCPVCEQAFTDTDDIVVCPDCGAPMVIVTTARGPWKLCPNFNCPGKEREAAEKAAKAEAKKAEKAEKAAKPAAKKAPAKKTAAKKTTTKKAAAKE